MRRAFGYDLLSCPNCGGKMQLLACIMERGAIRKILTHLGLPPDPPALARARASPDAWEQFDTRHEPAALDMPGGDVRPKCAKVAELRQNTLRRLRVHAPCRAGNSGHVSQK